MKDHFRNLRCWFLRFFRPYHFCADWFPYRSWFASPRPRCLQKTNGTKIGVKSTLTKRILFAHKLVTAEISLRAYRSWSKTIKDIEPSGREHKSPWPFSLLHRKSMKESFFLLLPHWNDNEKIEGFLQNTGVRATRYWLKVVDWSSTGSPGAVWRCRGGVFSNHNWHILRQKVFFHHNLFFLLRPCNPNRLWPGLNYLHHTKIYSKNATVNRFNMVLQIPFGFQPNIRRCSINLGLTETKL